MNKIISYLNSQRDNNQPSYLIIGAGLSGILLAKMMLKDEKIPLIVDKADTIGGVWATQANEHSHVQVDPVAYSSIVDETVYRPYAPTADVLKGIQGMAATHSLQSQIILNTNVKQIASNQAHHSVKFSFFDNHHIERKFEGEFDHVFIRTGTLNKPNNVFYEGESTFKHKIFNGFQNDIDLSRDTFVDQHVVIFGMGAFAIENAKTALRNGAKHVTIVARRLKPIFPKMAMYESGLSLTCLENIFSESKRNEYWKRFKFIFEKMLDIGGERLDDLKDSVINESQNEVLFDFRGGAVDDFFFLASHYGVLSLVQGVPTFTSDQVMVNGKGIKADIVIKCSGFTCDTHLIDGYPLNHTIFAGNPSLTHNINADCLHDTFYVGSKAAIPLLPIVSYPILSEVIETVVLYFQDHPSEYEQFKQQTHFLNTQHVGINNVNYQSYVQFFWDVLKSGNITLVGKIFEILQERHQHYLTDFSPDVAYAYNKQIWNADVSLLASKTGKDPLEYPFDECIERELPQTTHHFVTPIYRLAALIGISNSLRLLTFDWVQKYMVDPLFNYFK